MEISQSEGEVEEVEQVWWWWWSGRETVKGSALSICLLDWTRSDGAKSDWS